MKKRNKHNEAKPILRWVGGKTHITRKLLQFLPEDFYERLYFEPFLGGGSLFFASKPHKAYLSDANIALINCYKYVREKPKLISLYLKTHLKNSSEPYYYCIRKIYNRSNLSAAQAARFIYLNKTCFNGIFRVNKNGEFNVPYGRKDPPLLPSTEELISAAMALKKANLTTMSFENIGETINNYSFVYLDPPYPPLNGTANFTHYTKDRFVDSDQKKLSIKVKEVDKKGAKFIMTNADTPLIREFYSNYKIIQISTTRYVTCKSKKHQVRELIITNYDK